MPGEKQGAKTFSRDRSAARVFFDGQAPCSVPFKYIIQV